MNTYTLYTHHDNRTLFSGKYNTFEDCLEDAIFQKTDLSYIDLKYKNLSNLNLDGAIMPYADLKGSNLIGANMSECYLDGTIFDDSSLYNTCFAYSQMPSCSFLGCQFGATMIEGCNIQDSKFSTSSCFDLDFYLTTAMSGCIYVDQNYRTHKMSEPPSVLKGFLNTPIIILDQSIKVGSQFFSYEDALPSVLSLINQTLSSPFTDYKNRKITG